MEALRSAVRLLHPGDPCFHSHPSHTRLAAGGAGVKNDLRGEGGFPVLAWRPGGGTPREGRRGCCPPWVLSQHSLLMATLISHPNYLPPPFHLRFPAARAHIGHDLHTAGGRERVNLARAACWHHTVEASTDLTADEPVAGQASDGHNTVYNVE